MIDIEKRLERIEALVAVASKEVLNAHEAAALIGVSSSRIYHMTADREIPHYKKGNSVSFRKSELEAWMLGEKVPTCSEIEAQARRYTSRTKR